MTGKQKATAKLLKAAREQKKEGFNMALEAIDSTWGVLIQNMSAELELTEEQTQKLMRISDYYLESVRSYIAEGMGVMEFAEYMVEKSKQITKELHERWS